VIKALFRGGEKDISDVNLFDVSKAVDLNTLEHTEEMIIDLTVEQSSRVLYAKERGLKLGFRVNKE